MEKYLGWIVASVGAILLGVMMPIMAVSSPIQSSNEVVTSHVSTVATSQGTGGTAGSHTLGTPSVSEKVKFVSQTATDATGGGTVTNTTVDNSGPQPVWAVTVQQGASTYQVHISPVDYSVQTIQQLS